MSENKFDFISFSCDLLFYMVIIICFICALVFFPTITRASTVSENAPCVSDNTVERIVISSNYVSGNTLSGDISYDQGEVIIFLLSSILFMLVFSWCYDRIRNGIRSFKNTH